MSAGSGKAAPRSEERKRGVTRGLGLGLGGGIKVDQNSEEIREELCTKTVYIIGSPAHGRGTAGSGSGMIT
jgi:hypothetical protein